MWHNKACSRNHCVKCGTTKNALGSEGSNLKKLQIDSAAWWLQAVSSKTDCNARSISNVNLTQKTRVSMECVNREMVTAFDKILSSKMEKVLEEKSKLIIS